jgi:crotonobetainyl-CoA:carnitine CoA-transferase CaiB-like acyl-CoA transferase
MKMQKGLLEGIRVLDFTWHMTGPITTKHLSDLGAEVIII